METKFTRDISEDGLVQLRFADDDGNVHDIDASELAQVLEGLVEFTSQLAKAGAFGDGIPPQVRVRPPKQGSFVVEAVIWAGENPEAAFGMVATTGAAVVMGIKTGLKVLRGGMVATFDPLPNDYVRVNWVDGTASQLTVQTWDRLQAMKKPTRRALRKIMAPLGDDVQRLEVRQGGAAETSDDLLNTEPEVVAVRSDFASAATEPDEAEDVIDTFEVEAQLRSIDFRPGEKWRVETKFGTRLAHMDDQKFLAELDRGMAIHKNDIFNVKIREVRSQKDGRTTREWWLIDVLRKKRGDQDDNDSPTFQ